jgi:hypothetical protein
VAVSRPGSAGPPAKSEDCPRGRKTRSPFIYFNAALLYHEPLTRKAGEVLNLGYRVLVHDGPADAARIERASADFNAGVGGGR